MMWCAAMYLAIATCTYTLIACVQLLFWTRKQIKNMFFFDFDHILTAIEIEVVAGWLVMEKLRWLLQ